MKIINFLWGFSTGGIGKCFLTYDTLGKVEPNLQIKSICLITQNNQCDLTPLYEQHIEVITIKSNSDFSWMKRMKNIVIEERPDAFFCHGFNGPIMLYLLKMRYSLNIPMICTCHGVNLDLNKKANKYIDKAWMYIYRKKFVKKIICVEQFTPTILFYKGIDRNKVVTVYNGIEPTLYATPINLSGYCISAPIIITASRLTRIKGLNYLLDALKIIKHKGIKFHYFCIGNGEEKDALIKQTKEMGLDDVVSFMGYQRNIPEWLAACDIFALPSLEEYHSIGILEAMRAKKAIVATNIGGNPESLNDEENALMVPSMDAKTLADALERMITSDDLREKLSTNAYKRFKENFTVDIMMKNLAKELMTTKLL